MGLERIGIILTRQEEKTSVVVNTDRQPDRVKKSLGDAQSTLQDVSTGVCLETGHGGSDLMKGLRP